MISLSMANSILLLVLAGFSILPIVTSEESGLSFYKSWHKDMKDYFRAENYTIREADAKYILTKNVNDYNCKSACLTVSCKAWSVFPTKHRIECRLAMDGPVAFEPLEIAGATYYFTADSVGDYGFDEENIQYVKLANNTVYEEAKRICSSIPGHRLLMPKSRALFKFYYNTFGDVFMVDLVRGKEGYKWGDGTPFHKESEVPKVIKSQHGDAHPIFISWGGAIHDYVDMPFQVICQANPLNVPW